MVYHLFPPFTLFVVYIWVRVYNPFAGFFTHFFSLPGILSPFFFPVSSFLLPWIKLWLYSLFRLFVKWGGSPCRCMWRMECITCGEKTGNHTASKKTFCIITLYFLLCNCNVWIFIWARGFFCLSELWTFTQVFLNQSIFYWAVTIMLTNVFIIKIRSN